MLKGVNNLNDLSTGCDFCEHAIPRQKVAQTQHDEIYGSDEFRMYAYKIKKCSITRSHDWTDCPYAHRGEKATRRDPREVPYIAIACTAFRQGRCPKGDACEFAHGIFEYWLHPARYRTRACNAGRFCQRKVCFFAHTPEQLRSDQKKCVCPLVYKARMNGEDGMVRYANGSAACDTSSGHVRTDDGSYFEGVSVFLNKLRNLKISGNKDPEVDKIDETSFQLLHIDWISDLVK